MVGVSRRSSSEGVHAGTAARQIKPVQPIGPVRELHDGQGRVQQEPRDHEAPDEVESTQAIREVGHRPEDSQASRRPRQPAERRGPIQACRGPNLRCLGKARLGVVRVNQVGEETPRIGLMGCWRDTACQVCGQGSELGDTQRPARGIPGA